MDNGTIREMIQVWRDIASTERYTTNPEAAKRHVQAMVDSYIRENLFFGSGARELSAELNAAFVAFALNVAIEYHKKGHAEGYSKGFSDCLSENSSAPAADAPATEAPDPIAEALKPQG